jgi:predicted RNase H-like HicB family nuclease
MGGKLEHLDHYGRFVEWSAEDQAWAGYCPSLFPYGGVCYGSTSLEAFARLTELIDKEIIHLVDSGATLPPPENWFQASHL